MFNDISSYIYKDEKEIKLCIDRQIMKRAESKRLELNIMNYPITTALEFKSQAC